jgi:adenylyl-sulfate kinase
LKGVCVWFTGLPCSGKTTTAEKITEYLAESGEMVTLLDGDTIRPLLCPDLGFSRADRRSNVLRIAFVAREIVRHGGIVVTATVSPFDEDRKLVRSMFDPPRFVQVYIKTALEECERRDVKGHYAKARAGQLPMFTGISSPYEVPDDSEIICDTGMQSVTASAREVVQAVQYRRSERDVHGDLLTLRNFAY